MVICVCVTLCVMLHLVQMRLQRQNVGMLQSVRGGAHLDAVHCITWSTSAPTTYKTSTLHRIVTQKLRQTRNTFCGTWCLPHSQVHSDRTAPIIKVILHHCALAKRPYFHFRFKTWRQHRVSRPRFPKTRENFDVSRTFKADIGLLIFAWIFSTSWPKMEVLGATAKWRMVPYWPQRTRFYFLGFLRLC